MTSPACLACGSRSTTAWTTAHDVEYRTSEEAFTLYRCGSCRALFIDPVPRHRLQEIYPSNYYSFADPGGSFVHRSKEWLDRRLFGQILRGLKGSALNVLDVGGGSGWQLDTVRAADARVAFTQVVDFDPKAEQIARGRGHDYFCGRIEEFSSDRKFDLVLLLNLIEHVENPLSVLSKVAAMLSAGGRVLVKTPNVDSLDERIFRHANWTGYHTPRHWVLFTRESFERLARQAGLAPVSFRYTQGAPFWATSVIAWLAGRGITSVTKERPAMFHPLFAPLSALFALFDFMRAPVAKTSQMFIVLTRDRSHPEGG
jgi:2-polyprenyl-3-methyl-5-hydroxy-6-metoxy-1,4-benzoquinol methylase